MNRNSRLTEEKQRRENFRRKKRGLEYRLGGIIREIDHRESVLEDTIDNVSESDPEMVGLVFPLATNLVYEGGPMLLLDSLEAVDVEGIQAVVDNIAEHAPTCSSRYSPRTNSISLKQQLTDRYERVAADLLLHVTSDALRIFVNSFQFRARNVERMSARGRGFQGPVRVSVTMFVLHRKNSSPSLNSARKRISIAEIAS